VTAATMFATSVAFAGPLKLLLPLLQCLCPRRVPPKYAGKRLPIAIATRRVSSLETAVKMLVKSVNNAKFGGPSKLAVLFA